MVVSGGPGFEFSIDRLASTQEGKSGGMMEGEHMMEQKGDAMKNKGFGRDEGRRGQDGKVLIHEQICLL